MSTPTEIIETLKERGYDAKPNGTDVELDINPDIGECRTYSVIRGCLGAKWEVSLTELAYDDTGEETPADAEELGHFESASEIADAIEDHESEL